MKAKSSETTKNKSTNEMGCAPSKSSKEEVARDRRIAKELRRDFSKDAQIVKLLLLGAGESGKSTIVKQMKLLHPVNNRKVVGFSETERLEAKNAIYKNVIDSIVQLLEALDDFGMKLGNNQLEADRDSVASFFESIDRNRSNRASAIAAIPIEELTEQMRPPRSVYTAISRLWAHPGIKECYNRRNEFQLDDSAAYFLEEVERVCERDFLPTDQDILHTRVQTSAIIKIEFEYKDIVFHMYDVGGHRPERKKWIHCFDNVTAILFIVAISEYDKVLAEDSEVNRMSDSLQLFSAVANNEFLRLKPFIIFFNKTDLFREKIVRKSIKVAFPDYLGPMTYEDASEFIIEKFLSENRTSSNKRHIYTHMTTATDTELVKYVFNSVAEIILNEILRETGLN